ASEALLERFILERRTSDAEPWVPIYSERAVGDEQRGESYRHEDLQVQPGVEYQYRLRLVARDGQEQLSHVVSLTPLGDGEVWVGQSSPNPFGSQTSVELRLPENRRVRAEVVDALGRLVRVVVDDVLPAGNHLLTWDGTADGGVPAAAGTYRWRIFVGDQHYMQSITLVR
ncbi:MAG: FlgD immunoglobulin-like domain containing protein, partial [Chlorobiota bacterium]